MFDVIFPFDLLSNIANYLVIYLFIQFFFVKKYISKKKNIFLSLISLTPFFVNDVLFNWEYMYDQIRYVTATNHLRNFNFSGAEFEYGRIGSTVRYATYIYFLVPLPFLYHISSIGFMNKFLYVCFYVFLNNKKYLDNYTNIFYLTFPSLILYTSVSLRDTLIFIMCTSCVVCYLNKRYFSTLLILLITFLNRDVMAVLIFIVLVSHFIIFENKRYRNLIIFLFVILSLAVFFIFGDKIFSYINYYRIGLFWDHGVFPEDVPLITGKYNLIFEVFKNSLISFFIPSLNEVNNLHRAVQFLENIFLFIFLLFLTIKCFNYNKMRTLFWLFFILISLGLFAVVVDNPGTFVRYKFPVVMFFVTAFSLDCIIKNYAKSKKITFIVNHAAYLVSHRLKIVEKLIRDGWNCQILIGEAGSEIMEKDAYRILNEKKFPLLKMILIHLDMELKI